MILRISHCRIFYWQGILIENMKTLYKKGFTLIELLVVISIISLLSSVVLASLNVARLKGREAQRMANVKNLESALELYYDANGNYPAHNPLATYDLAYIGPALAPYLINIPSDPLGPSAAWGYAASGNTYMLRVYSETITSAWGNWCRTSIDRGIVATYWAWSGSPNMPACNF